MKRRDFLKYGATSSGLLVPAWTTLAAVCPPTPISVTGGTAVSTACGNVNAAADWTSRSTASGVVQAIRFASATPVNTYRHNDSMSARVVFDSTDGVIGDGCLRIDVPSTDGANSGAWRAPMSAAWTTDGDGFGSADFYIQYRLKLGPNRLTPSVGGGGFKVCNLAEYKLSSPTNSRSHPANEFVHGNMFNGVNNWSSALYAYREHPIAGPSALTEGDLGNTGGIHLQTAVDHGPSFTNINDRYCMYQSGKASAGCWLLHEQEWTTIYQHIKVADYGGAGVGNVFDLYVARPGETSYTHLFHTVDFRIGDDPALPKGVNGIWFLPYDTSRTSASYSTWHKYDQLIVSTSPIACPLV